MDTKDSTTDDNSFSNTITGNNIKPSFENKIKKLKKSPNSINNYKRSKRLKFIDEIDKTKELVFVIEVESYKSYNNNNSIIEIGQGVVCRTCNCLCF